MTRRTVQAIQEGTLHFKLGQENSFKSYINQFTSNPSALSKVQATEERIKRTHLSHKFSLTDASTFKWMGQIHGTRSHLTNTLRQSMLQMESHLPTIFMHTNWHILRKPWIQALNNSVTPRDFARALTVLQCCIKPCLLLNVWYDSLGHTQLKKITQQMRDDKKKSEKRERKEKEEEEERLRPFMTHVKYTLGLKHQVSKQRGEEYRAHGQNGWLWLSSTRRYSPTDAKTQGLRAGPHRLAVKYTDIRTEQFKIVLMEPKAFNYLLTKQDDLDKNKDDKENTVESKDENDEATVVKTENGEDVSSEEKKESPVKEDKAAIEKKKLEQALKNARLAKQVASEDLFKDVVDVSGGMTNPTRVLFPKVAMKTKFLDDFLGRRLQLKNLEERRIELKTGKPLAKKEASANSNSTSNQNGTSSTANAAASSTTATAKKEEGDEETETCITSHLADKSAEEKERDRKTFINQTKKSVWVSIAKLKEASAKVTKEKPKRPADLKCYSSTCSEQPLTCYSVTCKYYCGSSSAEIPALVKDAVAFNNKVAEEAKTHGLEIPALSEEAVTRFEDAISSLQELVKHLMKTKDEADSYEEMGISMVAGGEADDASATTTTTTTTSTTTTTTTTETVTKVNGEVAKVETTATKAKNVSKEVKESDGSSVKQEATEVKEVSAVSSKEKEDGTVEVKATEAVKNESIIIGKDGEEIHRVYSSTNSSGKLYLKRIMTVAESKKQSKVIKYPMAPGFYGKSRRKRNIIILAKHDAKRLARRCGVVTCEGFNYGSKANNLVWPYPCPRPSFRTSWLYRTASLECIQAVAMQLRILWACIKWDDMQTKPSSTDGKHQETTDSAISTKEILKHRHTGRFLEQTEYLQRKVTIPLDVPTRNKSEITPIRSGLRKRKRAESPVETEPKVVEDWIPEESLELWEIRGYREKLDRDRNASLTRSRTGTAIREPQRFTPQEVESNRRTANEVKAKLEEQYKNNMRASPGILQQSPQLGAAGSPQTTTQTIIRRIQNPDGTISIVRQTIQRPVVPTTVTPQPVQPNSGSPAGLAPGTKKVFISKDGKIIGAQLVQSPQTPGAGANTKIMPGGKLSIPTVGGVQNPAATPTILPNTGGGATSSPQQPQQKVQIIRSSDGKIQVKGLLPGQQLVQMPDGKLQIFSQPTNSTATGGQTGATTTHQTATPTATPPQGQGSRIVVHPGGATTTATPASPAKPNSNTATPTKPNQVLATQLAPGSPIPAGTTVFISGGKTYCIPKATTTVASQPQQQLTTTTPALPTTPVPQQQLTGTSTTTTSATTTPSSVATATTPSGQKQMVEVKALGANTVSFKGNQMIVSGPDVAQAQLIAKQLSSGAARLATLNGKQVLISTTPTSVPKSGAATPTTPATPTSASTPPSATAGSNSTGSAVKTEIPRNVKLPSEPLPPTEIKNEAPKPLQVTAQLIQTPQGPRIVLQGIQGSDLSKEQLMTIQQQVKDQLLKAQAEAKKQGKVPPTKIAIQLPGLAKPASSAAAASPATPTNTITSPGSATAASPSNQATPPRQIVTPSGQRVVLLGGQPSTGTRQVISLPTTPQPPSALEGTTTTTGPPAAVTQQIVQKAIATKQPPQVLLPQQPQAQSLLMSSLTSPQKVSSATGAVGAADKRTNKSSSIASTATSSSTASSAANATSSPDKFELTPDYIQQTIQNALKKENLSPMIEQKLLALQQHTNERGGMTASKSRGKQKIIDPATGEPMDDEWDGSTYASRYLASKNKKRRQQEEAAERRKAITPSAAASARAHSRTPKASTPTPIAATPEPISDERRRQKLHQNLQSMLTRHKEQLKRDISKKRKEQEKEIQWDIKQEIEKIKGPTSPPSKPTAPPKPQPPAKPVEAVAAATPSPAASKSSGKPSPMLLQNSYEAASSMEAMNNTSNKLSSAAAAASGANAVNHNKRKQRESDGTNNSTSLASEPKKKKQRRSSGATSTNLKKDKVYCICRTKYDPKK